MLWLKKEHLLEQILPRFSLDINKLQKETWSQRYYQYIWKLNSQWSLKHYWAALFTVTKLKKKINSSFVIIESWKLIKFYNLISILKVLLFQKDFSGRVSFLVENSSLLLENSMKMAKSVAFFRILSDFDFLKLFSLNKNFFF